MRSKLNRKHFQCNPFAVIYVCLSKFLLNTSAVWLIRFYVQSTSIISRVYCLHYKPWPGFWQCKHTLAWAWPWPAICQCKHFRPGFRPYCYGNMGRSSFYKLQLTKSQFTRFSRDSFPGAYRSIAHKCFPNVFHNLPINSVLGGNRNPTSKKIPRLTITAIFFKTSSIISPLTDSSRHFPLKQVDVKKF